MTNSRQCLNKCACFILLWCHFCKSDELIYMWKIEKLQGRGVLCLRQHFSSSWANIPWCLLRLLKSDRPLQAATLSLFSEKQTELNTFVCLFLCSYIWSHSGLFPVSLRSKCHVLHMNRYKCDWWGESHFPIESWNVSCFYKVNGPGPLGPFCDRHGGLLAVSLVLFVWWRGLHGEANSLFNGIQWALRCRPWNSVIKVSQSHTNTPTNVHNTRTAGFKCVFAPGWHNDSFVCLSVVTFLSDCCYKFLPSVAGWGIKPEWKTALISWKLLIRWISAASQLDEDSLRADTQNRGRSWCRLKVTNASVVLMCRSRLSFNANFHLFSCLLQSSVSHSSERSDLVLF